MVENKKTVRERVRIETWGHLQVRVWLNVEELTAETDVLLLSFVKNLMRTSTKNPREMADSIAEKWPKEVAAVEVLDRRLSSAELTYNDWP